MDNARHFRIKNKSTATLAGLALMLLLLYLGLVFILPKVTVFNRSIEYNAEGDMVEVPVAGGMSYEQDIVIPFDMLSGVSVDMGTHADNVVGIHGRIEVTDSSDKVVLSKEITSIYDAAADTSNVPVTRDGRYVLRVTFDSVDECEEDDIPYLSVNAETDQPSFTVSGRNSGAPNKAVFGFIFLIFSIVCIACAYYLLRDCIAKRSKLFERFIWWTLFVFSVFCFMQLFDLYMIIKGSLLIIEAAKNGSFMRYYDHSYLETIQSVQKAAYYGYNYNFFLLLPVVIVLLPVSFFVKSSAVDNGILLKLLVVYVNIWMMLFLFGTEYAARKICGFLNLDEKYTNSVTRLIKFSPLVLFVLFVFGQVDIIYVFVMMVALFALFKKKYYLFTLLMSVAVAMKSLPLMIFIPILLLVRKKPIDIIKHMLIVVACPLLTKVLFENTYGHTAIMNMMEHLHDFKGIITEYRIGNMISVYVLIYAVICFYAFSRNAEEISGKELLKEIMLVIFAVYGSFVVCTEYHDQWLIPLIVSYAFLLPLYGKDRNLSILNIAAESLLLVIALTSNASTYMVNCAFLPNYASNYMYSGTTVANILASITPDYAVILKTLLTACIVLTAWIMYKKRDEKVPESEYALSEGFIVGRILILYAVELFFFWCYFYIG